MIEHFALAREKRKEQEAGERMRNKIRETHKNLERQGENTAVLQASFWNLYLELQLLT